MGVCKHDYDDRWRADGHTSGRAMQMVKEVSLTSAIATSALQYALYPPLNEMGADLDSHVAIFTPRTSTRRLAIDRLDCSHDRLGEEYVPPPHHAGDGRLSRKLGRYRRELLKK